MAKILSKNKIPFIMTPRGALEPWCMKNKRIKKYLAWHLYQKSDLQDASTVLATCKMEADHLRKLSLSSPIAIIPNGIDVSEYPCRLKESSKLVKKRILFISRISPKKGIELLIDAWQQIYKQHEDWDVVIAGNGDEAYIQELKMQIKTKGLQDNINILPPVYGKEKYILYTTSSLFVLPTYSENFGMVIAEAMSCGLPVITTNGTPWQELNEKHLGWCIDLSVENLAKTISAAINLGQEGLFELGQRCSKHIHDTYQYTEVATMIKAVYEWIVNGGKRPEYVDVL